MNSHRFQTVLMLVGKGITVALGILSFILYHQSRFRTRDPFFAFFTCCLILSVISLGLFFKKRVSDHWAFKWVDITFHAVAAIGLLSLGIKFDVDVEHFIDEDESQEVQQLDWPKLNTAEAFASGIFAGLNGLVYALLIPLIWLTRGKKVEA